MSSKRLICITGMDGTGKSTLINALAQSFGSCTVAGIWDLLKENAQLFQSKRDVDNYLCTLTPDSRLLFLSHAMMYSIDKAMSNAEPVVLINAYIYKYFASELALGADPKLVVRLMQSFPKPNVTIRLTLPVAEAAKRKEKFSRYECGLAEHPSAENFTAFQNKCADAWKNFDQSGWHVIDSSTSPVKLSEQTFQLLSH